MFSSRYLRLEAIKRRNCKSGMQFRTHYSCASRKSRGSAVLPRLSSKFQTRGLIIHTAARLVRRIIPHGSLQSPTNILMGRAIHLTTCPHCYRKAQIAINWLIARTNDVNCYNLLSSDYKINCEMLREIFNNRICILLLDKNLHLLNIIKYHNLLLMKDLICHLIFKTNVEKFET